jgi:hypothetical protein
MHFERLTRPFRTFGIALGWLYALDRLANRISSSLGVYAYEFMVQPIREEPILPLAFAKRFEFREIHKADPIVEAMPARPEIKAARFEKGARCLAAFSKGSLLGYLWFCVGEYLEDEVRCRYRMVDRERSVFDFDLYIMPQYRLGVGFGATWHGANQYLWSQGVRYTFSRLSRFNVASRRSHDHLGWRSLGKAIFFKLWTVEVMFATLRPYVWISFSPRSRPTLALRPDVLHESA